MTKEKLRNALNEAKEKGQIGLLLWHNWSDWDRLGFELKPGNHHYDFALSQIEKNEEATIKVTWNGLWLPGIFVIPVQKLLSSDEFFTHVLNTCKKGKYRGPITLIPLNEVSKSS